MDREDCIAIINYWIEQDDIANTLERSMEISDMLQIRLGQLAIIEMFRSYGG